MTNECQVCELLDYCECPEPPTHWELYSTELDGELREWAERANDVGFAWQRWLKKFYGPHHDRLHELSTRASPMMSVFA